MLRILRYKVRKMTIFMNLGEDSYDIVVQRGILSKANEYLELDRRVLVVTDSGVPECYAKAVADQCKNSVICTLEQGEGSKSLEAFGRLLQVMLDNGFSRKDCVVAVGGGVVGDISGFAASAYMRGIDFYNIPTTLLSQIDSSIGGKTAINLGSVKNIVGAFYQPKKVLIDPDLLTTLPARQISNGLAEAVKMALTSDEELFDIFEDVRRGDTSYMTEYRSRSMVLGKRVTFVKNGFANEGVAVDIEGDGGLVVETDIGERTVLNSGEITLRIKD